MPVLSRRARRHRHVRARLGERERDAAADAAAGAGHERDAAVQRGFDTGAFDSVIRLGDVPSFRVDSMPYGGVRDSGLGREGVRFAIEEMTEPKIVVINRDLA